MSVLPGVVFAGDHNLALTGADNRRHFNARPFFASDIPEWHDPEFAIVRLIKQWQFLTAKSKS